MRFLSDQNWLINSNELLSLKEELSAQKLCAQGAVSEGFDFNPTHRLGVYFEQLWAHIIKQSNELELSQHNLQVIIDKHTYGEFDSIVFDKATQEHYHCELAVKFYLNVGTGGKLSDWVGPNLKDRFDHKYHRLFNHQLKLSRKEPVDTWLNEKGINVDGIKLLTKGRLFYPYNYYIKNNFSHPKEVNPSHEKGFWINHSELEELIATSEYQWHQLPKFCWLATVEPQDIGLLEAIEKEPSQNNRKGSMQQIVALQEGREVMRGFVVTDEWLDKAKQRIQD